MDIQRLIEFYEVYHYIGLLAWVASIYFYITKKVSFPLIIPFLALNCFVELILVYYFILKIRNSIIVYNYFNIIVILYYLFVYYDYFKKKSWAINIIYAAVSWLVYVLYIFSTKNLYNEVHHHYLIGLVITVVLIFALFKDILESKEMVDLKKLPIFYFSLGILLLFFCALPILVFSKTLLIEDNRPVMNTLIQIANIFLNLGYLCTVLWTGLNKKIL